MSAAATAGDFTMPWGKWRNTPISELQYGYLLWLVYLPNLHADIRKPVEQEIMKRGWRWGKFAHTPLDQIPTWYLEFVKANLEFIQPIHKVMIESILEDRL